MESHLLQMRGLKLSMRHIRYITPKSHLLQMRGLKRIDEFIEDKLECRIFYRCVD